MTDITNLLIRTGFTVFIVIILLRWLLQLSRADFYNPISQLLAKATDPLFLPVQRLLGGTLSAVLLAILLQVSATVSLIAVNSLPFPPVWVLIAWAFIGSMGLIINIYLFAIIIVIVLSWIAPTSHHPAVALLHQLTEPVMGPFRKVVPSLGGLDLSPLLIFLIINVMQIALRHIAIGVGVFPALVIGI